MNSIINALSWRYATKKYDTAKKISPEMRHELLEAARLSASSFGLQPWKFLVIDNPETRKQLRAVAWDQSAVTDSSLFVVLCTKTTIDEAYVDHYMQTIATTRGIDSASLAGFKKMILGSLQGRSENDIVQWNKHQTYIALGTLLTTAALHEIDSTPMEGFDAAKVDEILGLKAEGYTVAAFFAAGYRSSEDTTAAFKKVRFSTDEVISIR